MILVKWWRMITWSPAMEAAEEVLGGFDWIAVSSLRSSLGQSDDENGNEAYGSQEWCNHFALKLELSPRLAVQKNWLQSLRFDSCVSLGCYLS